MDLETAIWSRRTVHSFLEDDTISQNIISKAIEAAALAPNHKFTFPWKFLQLGENTRQKLLDSELELLQAEGSFTETRKVSLTKKLFAPSYILVALAPLDGSEQKNEEDYASISCGLQNMFLYLWSMGVGSKWSTGKLTRSETTYNTLEISQDSSKIAGFIYIGKPETVPEKAKRPKIDSLLTVLD